MSTEELEDSTAHQRESELTGKNKGARQTQRASLYHQIEVTAVTHCSARPRHRRRGTGGERESQLAEFHILLLYLRLITDVVTGEKKKTTTKNTF